MNRISRFLPDIGGIYCLVVFFALTAFAGGRALIDGDTLWHIKAGEVMLERGTVLTTDIFSHTAYGHPWMAHEWLAEVIMAAIHSWAGVPGVVIFYFLLTALSFWLLFLLANPYDDPWLAFFCISIAFGLALSHLLARPHIFSWFFGTLTLYLLTRRGRWLYILPPLTALWANIHGGFVLGLVLQGLYLAGSGLERGCSLFRQGGLKSFFREQQRPLLVLLLSVLATGLNPFGFDLLLFPFRVSAGTFSTFVSEWGSPNLQYFWPFRLDILFILFLLFFRGPQVSWTNRLFVLFFLNAAMVHARYVSIAGIFLTPFALATLAPVFDKVRTRIFGRQGESQLLLSKSSGPITTVLLAFVLIFLAGAGIPGWGEISKEMFPLPKDYSVEAVRYLKQHPPAGNMFNQDDLGDYFLYALGPDFPVFIDGRLDMYGEDLLKDYMKISEVTEDTDRLLSKYNIDWVVFPLTKPLVLYLKATKKWGEVYHDDQISILVRKVAERP